MVFKNDCLFFKKHRMRSPNKSVLFVNNPHMIHQLINKNNQPVQWNGRGLGNIKGLF